MTLFAYIDPFTGSLLIQLLIAGFVAILVFLRRVKTFVLGLFGIKPTVESIDETEAVATITLDGVREEKKVA